MSRRFSLVSCLVLTACLDQPAADLGTTESDLSYSLDPNNGAVLIFRPHGTAIMTVAAPECTATAVYTGAQYSNIFVTAKHCVMDLRASGGPIADFGGGGGNGRNTTALSNWSEYDVSSSAVANAAGLCLQVGGGTGTGTCAAPSYPAPGTAGTVTHAYRIWAPDDQNADFAFIQTYHPLAVTPQFLTHTWGYANGHWVSEDARDVNWAAFSTANAQLYMYGFQKLSNGIHDTYSYFTYASSSDPAAHGYTNSYISNYTNLGYTPYFVPNAGQLNAGVLAGGGPVFTQALPTGGTGGGTTRKGYFNSTLLGVIATATHEPSSVVVNPTAATAIATGIQTSQEMVRWLNTPPGGYWNDFPSMHGWYNGYQPDAAGVAAGIHGVAGTTYTTALRGGALVTVSLTDNTGGSAIADVARYVQNYWRSGNTYYPWYEGTLQGAAQYNSYALPAVGQAFDPASMTTSPASSRSFARAVANGSYVQMPKLARTGAAAPAFAHAQSCASGAVAGQGYSRGCAADTGGDSVSYLGQSCDTRDVDGHACSTSPAGALACAETSDLGWGGIGRSAYDFTGSYRCVYANAAYYQHAGNGFDIFRGTTPAAGASASALMYRWNGTAATATGVWERAIPVGPSYVEDQAGSQHCTQNANDFMCESDGTRPDNVTVANDTGSTYAPYAGASATDPTGWYNRVVNATLAQSQRYAYCTQTASYEPNTSSTTPSATPGCPVGFYCAASISGEGICLDIPTDDN